MRNTNGPAASAAAIALLGSGMLGMSPAVMRDVAQARDNHDEFRKHIITKSKRIPKPEEMFAALIKSGRARVVRRRYKQPLLVFALHKVEER